MDGVFCYPVRGNEMSETSKQETIVFEPFEVTVSIPEQYQARPVLLPLVLRLAVDRL